MDLKLGMPSAAFVEAYAEQPLFVADVTYDDDDAAGGGGAE